MSTENRSITSRAFAISGIILLGILGLGLSGQGQVLSQKIEYQIASFKGSNWHANSLATLGNTSESTKIERKSSLLGDIRAAQELIHVRQYQAAIAKLQAIIKLRPDLEYTYVLLGEVYLQTNNVAQLEGLIAEVKKRFQDHQLASVLALRKDIMVHDFLAATQKLKILTADADLQTIPADVLFYYGTFAALQNDHELAQAVFKILDGMPVKKLELVVSAEGLKDTATHEYGISPNIAERVSNLVAIYQDFKQVSDGEDPHLFTLIGKNLAQNNELILARGFADIALREKPDYTDAWIVRGYTYYLQNQFADALADFNAAYKLDPIRPEIHYFLALTLTELGRDSEAALYYEKVLEQPSFSFETDLKWRLVTILLRQKKYEQVLGIYQSLATETDELEPFVSPMHQLIELAKRPDLALELAETLYKTHPNEVLAANLYAWALIADEQIVKAEGVLNKALKQESENPRTYLNLGLASEKNQKITEAAEFYKQAYDLAKANRAYAAVANLAAEAYNRLTVDVPQPANVEVGDRQQNSP